MAPFYADMQETASGLLEKFGAKETVTRTVKGVYDPRTGKYGPDTVTTWTPYAVKTGIKEEFFADSLIQVGDMQLLVDCAEQPLIPQKGDTVTFANGEKWAIVKDMPVDPSGTVVLYKGIIRKG